MTGRDDARARPSHPTVDELADLREGVLSDGDAARVQAHVDDCAECMAETAALDEVAAVLRDVGAEPVTMPSAVARAIDDAVAAVSAERAAAPTPATPAASPSRVAADSEPPRRLRWVKPAMGWLAGAAAAVVVIGGIGVGLDHVGSNTDNNAGGGGADSAVEGAQPPSPARGQAGGVSGKDQRAPEHIDEGSIRTYARALASDRDVPSTSDGVTAPTSGSEYAVDCPAPQGMGGLKRTVVWHGANALLVVRREARVASVYTCDATPRLLYSAPY